MATQIRQKTKVTGVYKVHARDCRFAAKVAEYRAENPDVNGRAPAVRARLDRAIEAIAETTKCNCEANFQATAYSARDRKLIRQHFATPTEAARWRRDIGSAIDQGKVRAGAKMTVTEAGAKLLAGMRDGTIESRKGRPYAEPTIDSYEDSLDNYILPELGRVKVSAIDRRQIKRLVATWKREGLAASTINNNLCPLRVILNEALEDGEITVDPMYRMKLPQGGEKRERVADTTEARTLLDALPGCERALWAVAMYGGLRRSELRALRWNDIELGEVSEIRVRRTWNVGKAERVGGKSDAAMRDVVLTDKLRKILAEHKLLTGRGGDDLVFGRVDLVKGEPASFAPSLPFVPSTVRARALRAWGWKPAPNPELARNPKASPREIWIKAREDALEPIILHESRHTWASYSIAAGLGDLELTDQAGHSDVRTTKNIYGHLFPGFKEKVRAQIDDYHAAAAE
jgi:integrase